MTLTRDDGMISTQGYFDARHLTPQLKNQEPRCPVSRCGAVLERVPSQWGEMPFCPMHFIRIHSGSGTFVYYTGSDQESRRKAALRNILFENRYFADHILGNAVKAETHRICHETSEDALTWNVFSRLATAGVLRGLVSNLTNQDVKANPELYLWGLKCSLKESSTPLLFPPLAKAREVFEPDIRNYLTEPDIMLYVPGRILMCIEAKFTSGNPIATANREEDILGEKPASRAGILRRYTAAALPDGALLADAATTPFYSQLYRNVVFAMHMAEHLGVQWAVVSLVSEGQCQKQRQKPELQDPTPAMHALLPATSRKWFAAYSWERLYADHVANNPALADLAEYMSNKSAYCVKAFAV